MRKIVSIFLMTSLFLLLGCSSEPKKEEVQTVSPPVEEPVAQTPEPLKPIEEPPAPEAETKPAPSAPKTIKTASGLRYQDLVVGKGASPKAGNRVRVHYTGWLTDGTKFDSSLDRGVPFDFTLGRGEVIPGWDEGVATMKVGGKRKLTIPPQLAYGSGGAGGVIPPNATLIFEVELLAVQ